MSQVFPNPAPLDRPAAAVVAELHDAWQVFDRRYFSEASMAELFTAKPTEPDFTPQPELKQLPRLHHPAGHDLVGRSVYLDRCEGLVHPSLL
jgi:hypothetical protein